MKRRTFLSYGAIAAAPLLLPNFQLPLLAAIPRSGRKLVMVHLKGGNDGYNTVIPHRNLQYYKARPTLAIAQNEIIKLDNDFGLNPALKSLGKHFKKGNMLIINNVSSNELDSSHFSATQLWETGSAEEQTPWIQKALRSTSDASKNTLANSLAYTCDDFIEGMQDLAREINKNPAEHIYQVSLDGFDTHQFQKNKHNLLLATYANGIDHLLTELEASDELKNTTIVTWSEFGRQLKENTKKGTDHGDSNSLLIYGGSLKKSGIWKNDTHPDSIVDFRQIHSTIAINWLNTSKDLFKEPYHPMNWI